MVESTAHYQLLVMSNTPPLTVLQVYTASEQWLWIFICWILHKSHFFLSAPSTYKVHLHTLQDRKHRAIRAKNLCLLVNTIHIALTLHQSIGTQPVAIFPNFVSRSNKNKIKSALMLVTPQIMDKHLAPLRCRLQRNIMLQLALITIFVTNTTQLQWIKQYTLETGTPVTAPGISHYLVCVCAVACCSCIFFISSSSCMDSVVSFLPMRSWMSRYLATHRSRQTLSPLERSGSLYFVGMHFFWQAAVMRLYMSDIISISKSATSCSFEGSSWMFPAILACSGPANGANEEVQGTQRLLEGELALRFVIARVAVFHALPHFHSLIPLLVYQPPGIHERADPSNGDKSPSYSYFPYGAYPHLEELMRNFPKISDHHSTY